MELGFEELKREVLELYNGIKYMVLATSSNNQVTARSMSCVFEDINILFQTDIKFAKVRQIQENTQVALCANNLQIEGIAQIKGSPMDVTNIYFIDEFKRQHESSYNNYSRIADEVVIEVAPSKITLWKYENGIPFRDFLLVEEKKAYREYYEG
ncbi:MAG: hypothetical protein H6Q75_416 [Firmicutes bacterium]|nr:hypothetical protein [Bacillota bacterium]